MQRRMKYYRDVFGSSDNEDVEALLFQALNYGPEQSAVYSREMAQGAAACCPNGCGEERLRRAGIDELLVLERDAIAAVHDANMNLQYAQAKAAVSVLETDDPKMHMPQKGNKAEMDNTLKMQENLGSMLRWRRTQCRRQSNPVTKSRRAWKKCLYQKHCKWRGSCLPSIKSERRISK